MAGDGGSWAGKTCVAGEGKRGKGGGGGEGARSNVACHSCRTFYYGSLSRWKKTLSFIYTATFKVHLCVAENGVWRAVGGGRGRGGIFIIMYGRSRSSIDSHTLQAVKLRLARAGGTRGSGGGVILLEIVTAIIITTSINTSYHHYYDYC